MMSFGDVAELVFKRLLARKVVYFVTDQYKPGSIKSLEREKRIASDGTMWVRIEKKWAKATEEIEEILEKWWKYIGAC